MAAPSSEATTPRLAQWRAGWRVSLRMARRDVRRHRGRSLLIVIMVGLPVLLLTAGSTLWFSEDVDAAERLPFQLGQTQGYLIDPMDFAIHQLVDPRSSYGNAAPEAKARPVPGYAPGAEGEALSRLLGAQLHPVTLENGTARVGTRHTSAAVLGIDPRGAESVLAPRATLESGRWPTAADEVVVTDLGLASGLPRSGTIHLQVATDTGMSAERPVTIVGVGTGFGTYGADDVHPVELVRLPSGSAERQWLVDRATPITWPEIERLNTYGVGAFSRHVVEHPETVVIPADASMPNSNSTLFLVLAASTGLLLLTTLLAGPAFAVSAARQRHSLALAASNGATLGQLRRTVLAQGLVLGVLAAVVGAALGLAVGLVAVRGVHTLSPDHFFAPSEISWGSVAIVTLAGVVSSVVAALVPSRGLGRLDITAVLKGQHVSPPLRRRVPATGVLVAALGVGAVSYASYRSADAYFYVFVGGVLLIAVGAILLVPLVLAGVARFGHRLPLPTRMAAREAGRLRGRATPTVAAIMGGAAVLTTVCIGLQADTERGARTYSPEIVEGQAIIYPGPGPSAVSDVALAVHAADPSLRTLAPRRLTDSLDGTSVRLAAVRPGCSFAETAPDLVYSGGLTIDGDTLPPCATVSADAVVPGATLLVVDEDEFADFVGLDPAQRATFARGAVALLDPKEAALLPPSHAVTTSGTSVEDLRPLAVPVTDGTSAWHRYTVRYGTDGLPKLDDIPHSVVRLPTMTLTHEQWVRAVVAGYGGPGAFLPTAAAERLGLSSEAERLLVRADAALTDSQESGLRDSVLSRFPGSTVTVERGYQRHDALIIGIVIAVIALIILVATLIATALGQAEAAPMLGTLAAVGATRTTRRALGASQAGYLALVGSVFGVLVGLAPGVAASRILTASYAGPEVSYDSVIISIPWVQILAPVLLVPMVAAALAWVSIRRAPVVVRRAT
ncbi:ABC transporter permease [Terracoccus sp. 273MFTsu3.1]|uniref:ABC transporter permease n=1 Tax=Terracoccus sp. 273MFTsu3.1 TaxID=1172188 RepID=UPI000364684A|nr:ABC transporter permease [Terracoccus sp. 273MFTsu3.1]